jgi:hypothetical protein
VLQDEQPRVGKSGRSTPGVQALGRLTVEKPQIDLARQPPQRMTKIDDFIAPAPASGGPFDDRFLALPSRPNADEPNTEGHTNRRKSEIPNRQETALKSTILGKNNCFTGPDPPSVSMGSTFTTVD